MTRQMKAALVCYLMVALAGVGVGVRYLSADQIMSYHQAAMGATWEAMTPQVRVMTLNYMRAAGLGFLMVGISIGFLLAFPFRRGERWSYYALSTISLVFFGTQTALVSSVYFTTPGSPPLLPIILVAGLSIAGTCLSFMGKNPDRPHPV
jgi:hypothetical protein